MAGWRKGDLVVRGEAGRGFLSEGGKWGEDRKQVNKSTETSAGHKPSEVCGDFFTCNVERKMKEAKCNKGMEVNRGGRRTKNRSPMGEDEG